MSNDEPSSKKEDASRFEDATLAPQKNSTAFDATLAPGAKSGDIDPPKLEGFGDYEVTGEIARGGMGVVFRGKQKSLNRDVAIKMILAGEFASQDEVDRFYTEAEAAAKLDHPNIVPIYDIGQHEGRHYFSMKLIEGQHLGERLTELREELPKCIQILVKVCKAVAHAHQRGILHRDLKPANILLDRDDEPYVTDLGLARRVDGDSQLTRTGAILGTPSYMPPEQAQGSGDITTSADIYSLGAILYEIMTGRPPFKGSTPLETMMQVINEAPEKPSFSGTKDRGLELICLKCLEKEPHHRYPSVDSLAKDLVAWLNDDPISVRAPSVANLTRFWLKQNFGRGAWTFLIGPAFGIMSALSLWYGTINRDFDGTVRLYENFPGQDPKIPWFRISTPEWMDIPFLIAFAVSIVFIGFVTARFVRPKNRGADLAIGSFVGFFSCLTGFMFGLAPLCILANLDRGDLNLANRVVQTEGAEENVYLVYPALEQLEPNKQVELLIAKTGQDHLYSIPTSLWMAVIVCFAMYFVPSVFETWVAGPIVRETPGWFQSFFRYWESTFPIVAIMTIGTIVLSTRLIFGAVGLLVGLPILLLGGALLICYFVQRWKAVWPLRAIAQLLLIAAFVYFFAKDVNSLPGLSKTKAAVYQASKLEDQNPADFRYTMRRLSEESKLTNLYLELDRPFLALELIDKCIGELDNANLDDRMSTEWIAWAQRSKYNVRFQKVLVLTDMQRFAEAEKLMVEIRQMFPDEDVSYLDDYLEKGRSQ